MNTQFSNEVNSHLSSMKKDMKGIVEKEVKSLVLHLEAEGIIIAKRDDKGCPYDISFTEEGKAYMEILAFNLSHRLKEAAKKDDSLVTELHGIIAALEGFSRNGFNP